jgi:PIN domain nuclease of toxin-antitoxin system
LAPRFLLDTHVVIRWLADPKRLSKEQRAALELSCSRQEQFAVSGISLLEIALFERNSRILKSKPAEVLASLEAAPEFLILPITFEIAAEIAAMGPSLRDPADRTIVATARVHRLRLLTSDQRIINSKLVPTIE